MSKNVMEDILRSDDLGQKAHANFVSDSIIGDKKLWDKMSKLNLKTYKSVETKLKVQIQNETVGLKNRSLFARMATEARSRPETDLEEVINTYEFPCVLRALFASDSSELPCTDKRKLLHIWRICHPRNQGQLVNTLAVTELL